LADDVAVVVCSYRRPNHLRRCLRAIDALQSAPYEVVVVVRDDDRETAAAVDEFRWARRITVGRPGVIAAMRAGVAATSGEIVLLLDDDAQVPSGWLGGILEQLADPVVGGACGRDVVTDPDSDRAELDVGRITACGKMVGNHHLAGGPARDVEILKGAAMVMRRQALAFPIGLRGAGAEVHWEVATCLAARQQGFHLRLDPACRALHLPGPRFDADRRERPRSRAVFDAAYNLVVCIGTFRPGLRWRRVAYGVAVGDAATPGIARGGMALLQRRWPVARRAPAAVAGQLAGALAVLVGKTVKMSSPEFDRAWSAVTGVEGWMTEAQARLLFRSAADVEAGSSIVEVGSHHGRSTVILARAAQEGITIVAIDPFDDPRWGGGTESLEIFSRNIRNAEVGDRVRLVRSLSSQALASWDGGSIGMVYVDGAHDRATAFEDIDGWARRLRPCGLLLVHDSFSSVGVTLAVLQRFLARNDFEYVGVAGSLLALRRSDRGVGGRLALSAHLVGRLPYFVRNLLVKIALRRRWFGVSRLLGHGGENPPY
jgi:predicted O-methyltransferase YrrM/GT2 family glycosyltransferase